MRVRTVNDLLTFLANKDLDAPIFNDNLDAVYVTTVDNEEDGIHGIKIY